MCVFFFLLFFSLFFSGIFFFEIRRKKDAALICCCCCAAHFVLFHFSVRPIKCRFVFFVEIILKPFHKCFFRVCVCVCVFLMFFLSFIFCSFNSRFLDICQTYLVIIVLCAKSCCLLIYPRLTDTHRGHQVAAETFPMCVCVRAYTYMCKFHLLGECLLSFVAAAVFFLLFLLVPNDIYNTKICAVVCCFSLFSLSLSLSYLFYCYLWHTHFRVLNHFRFIFFSLIFFLRSFVFRLSYDFSLVSYCD